ncbi:hypothetical protein ACFYYP_24950 [Microbispora rosea]|uniref:hypothetical protein n=1 Tax=Microbispora rosea TaxID=58117 RepID=UPI0036AAB184
MIMTSVLTTISAAFGGLFGALFAPFILKYPERRKARSDVLEHISQIEIVRWADAEESSLNALRTACNKFRAASLCAGLYRPLIELYILLAEMCWHYTRDSMDHPGYDSEVGAILNTRIATNLANAIALVSESIWHPLKFNLHRRSKLRNIYNILDGLSADGEIDALSRAAWDEHRRLFGINSRGRVTLSKLS